MKTNLLAGIIAMVLCLLGTQTVQAQVANDSTQAVAHLTINGVAATQVMAEMTFRNNNIYVAYTDGTVATLGTSDLIILTFEGGKMPEIVPPVDPEDPSALQEIHFLEIGGIVGDELMIGGVADGTTIRIYSLQGLLMTETTYHTGASINISTMPAGVYLLQAGKEVVKFKK